MNNQTKTVKELAGMKKAELLDYIGDLYQQLAEQELEVEKFKKEIGAMKAKHEGVIGYGARKNPLVR